MATSFGTEIVAYDWPEVLEIGFDCAVVACPKCGGIGGIRNPSRNLRPCDGPCDGIGYLDVDPTWRLPEDVRGRTVVMAARWRAGMPLFD